MADGVPFYSLVRPEVPVADHTAAKIIASTDLAGSVVKGFSAMAQANAQRQRAELEAQQLAQEVALKQEGFSLQRQKMAQDYSLERTKMGLTSSLYDAHRDVFKAQADLVREKTNQLRENAQTAIQHQMEFNRQISELKDEAKQRAIGVYKLTDPKFQTENPIEFAANFLKFKDEYQFAPTASGIPKFIKDTEAQVNSQKIKVREGATFDPIVKKWIGGGEGKEVPIWQVVQNLGDPEKREPTLNALKAAGHITQDTYQAPGDPETLNWFGKKLNEAGLTNFAPTPKTVTYEKRPPFIDDWIKKGRTVDFSHVPSRVPIFSARENASNTRGVNDARTATNQTDIDQAAQRLQSEAQLPTESTPPPAADASLFPKTQTDKLIESYKSHQNDPNFDAEGAKKYMRAQGVDVGQLFPPTETDVRLNQARAAIARGANREAVTQKLRDMGIDPSKL
jgi:hypothetical protein